MEAIKHNLSIEYFNESGLNKLMGLNRSNWGYAIFKELLDNSLDAVDTAFSNGDIKEKHIFIKINSNSFEIKDNAGGVPEKTLDKIYNNFSYHVSSKKELKLVSRGMQGNALKTIIGACYIENYNLIFNIEGKAIQYKPISAKIEAGFPEFEQNEKITNNDDNSIVIEGIEYTPNEIEKIKKALNLYSIVNLDTNFHIMIFDENIEFSSRIEPINKLQNKTFIHWLSFQEFNKLLQLVNKEYEGKTIKQFIGEYFNNTQRKLSELNIEFKYLSEIAEREEVIKSLYNQLKQLTKEPSNEVIKAYNLTDRKSKINKTERNDIIFEYFNYADKPRYYFIEDYQHVNGVKLPYIFEGFLFKDKQNKGDNTIVATVNNTVPYDDNPFYYYNDYSYTRKVDYPGDYPYSLNLLDESYTLYLNFISPYLNITDTAKTQINIDTVYNDVKRNILDKLFKPTVERVKKKRKEKYENHKKDEKEQKKGKNRAKRERAKQRRELSKKEFLRAYNKASDNGEYSITVRQLFYKLREILNVEHKISLNDNFYNTFTQHIVTEMMEDHPELSDKILFERRGYFINPFDDKEIPLSTKEVNAFIKEVHEVEPNLLFPHVLFIEKQGYDEAIKKNGLSDELNLGLMCTQGFATRAVKTLMEYFINLGIDVYVLHDCDLAGYLIANNFKSGSKTYKQKLNVIDIGLNVDDVFKLGIEPEIAEYKNSYKKVLETLSEKERSFFIYKINKHGKNKFKRAELNALSSKQFIEFIRSKIPYKPIIPEREQIKKFIRVKNEDYIWMMLNDIINDISKEFKHQIHKELVKETEFDNDEETEEIIEELHDELLAFEENNIKGKHWKKMLDTKMEMYPKERAKAFQEQYENRVKTKFIEFIKNNK